MSRTIQLRSWAAINNKGKDLTIPRIEDNLSLRRVSGEINRTSSPCDDDNFSLLLNVYDSLNELYEKLSRLAYVMQRKNIENILYHRFKEKK